jgi:hypothetical protein
LNKGIKGSRSNEIMKTKISENCDKIGVSLDCIGPIEKLI